MFLKLSQYLLFGLFFLKDMETQLQQESDTANDQIQSLEDNVRSEKQRREDAEQELLKQKQVKHMLLQVNIYKMYIECLTRSTWSGNCNRLPYKF